MVSKQEPLESTVPRISVVVCTSGIRATIGHALEALLGQTLPAQDYEVVLVVNTAELSDYAQAKARLSTGLRKEHVQVRFAHEPCLGLSVARNTGIRVAEGRYVAFIDDDGLADPRWLEQIVTRFEADERVASVGGNIFPLFEVEPPSWVTPHLYPYFSCKTFSKDEEYLGPGLYFFGTNMAFRKDVLVASGGFDACLGRKGNNLLSNEEWTVFHYIDQQGLLKLSSPQVNVRHMIPPSRLMRWFFVRRLWWQGVSDTVFHLCVSGRGKGWVLRKAWNDFIGYYGNLSQKIRSGASTPHMAFFNFFRWGGILYALCATGKVSPCETNIKD
nr:glycosyltransferase family 2 protein [Pseudodesulfovibrio aespoeensis]